MHNRLSPVLHSMIKLITIVMILLLQACASVEGPADENDPLESYNRAMYAFNDGFDTYLHRPVAEVYDDYTPKPIKSGIANFFSNVGDVVVITNDLLQLKFEQMISDFSRLIVNSTFGVLGLFDVATPMGLPKHEEDFGQSLGYWGVGKGAYLVLPILGDSTIRDSIGYVVDLQYHPITQIEDSSALWATAILYSIDTRAQLLSASKILQQAALDPYSFRRDAYLQRRQYLIYDGTPPSSTNQDIIDDKYGNDFDLELELELELEMELNKIK